MTSDKIIKIINARILLNHEIVQDSYLWYQNGKIIHPQDLFFSARRDADEIIDAKGLLVVPGFIETQINGAYGIDFADHEEPIEVLKENVNKVAQGLLRYGCTAFCPTVVSSVSDVYKKFIPLLNHRPGSVSTGATILGAHIEGPFIALEKKGAHNPEVLRDAKNGIKDLDEAYGPELKKGKEAVRIITMAPEIEGFPWVIQLVKLQMQKKQ
ncbi:hypothetical protein G6F56_011186 [Rhizopus delemar]|nr:hypothetical protein G6F56_011186 [Rhizopus delemar]